MKKDLNKFGAREKAFTLIELIVVIAIIAILAAIVMVSVVGYIAKAKDGAIKAMMKQFQTCANTWVMNTGEYYYWQVTDDRYGEPCQKFIIAVNKNTSKIDPGIGNNNSTGSFFNVDANDYNGNNPNDTGWCYEALLNDDSGWCVDSKGFFGPANGADILEGGGPCSGTDSNNQLSCSI